MPNLRPGDIPLLFGGVNPAAAASEAALWPVPLADVNDVDGFRMPFAGAVVGVVIVGAPASGDTLQATPRVNTTNVTGISATITNAAPTAQDWGDKEDHSSQAFAAGDIVKCRYITTTGGTYTVKDTLVQVWVRPHGY